MVLGVLLIDKNILQCTGADGRLRAIQISKVTLGIALEMLQDIINALLGRSPLRPSA